MSSEFEQKKSKISGFYVKNYFKNYSTIFYHCLLNCMAIKCVMLKQNCIKVRL